MQFANRYIIGNLGKGYFRGTWSGQMPAMSGFKRDEKSSEEMESKTTRKDHFTLSGIAKNQRDSSQ